MSIYKIHHITKYLYDSEVFESANQIKIFPFPKEGQDIMSQEIKITGDPILNKFFDYWGNGTAFFTLNPAHKELVIDSRLIVSAIGKEIDESVSTLDDWQELPNLIQKDILLLDYSSCEKIEHQEIVDDLINELELRKLTPIQAANKANQYIYENYKYVKGITTIETTVDEIIQLKSGVCQDFAHLLLHILRSLGLPARYVSGYICPNRSGMRGEGATHAWVDVYIPNLGWIGIDPTNNCYANINHIQLAVGRDFTDCTPIKGVFKGSAKQNLLVYVSVGYEDGHIFEETNTVQMQKEQTIVAANIILEQHQQQQ
jgi:transglutaminase-like putative cysteine protease